MYESLKYEDILGRMLDKVPSDMDKREGSIIYDALAPCAIEVLHMYMELDVILRETFGESASREYLLKRGEERGLAPYEATKAILKGEFNTEVPIGSKFMVDKIYYTVLEKLDGYCYKLECDTYGKIGNGTFGDITPIQFINGLSFAKITELLIPAVDEEETENFRKRYFDSFSKKAFGGNISDYVEKVNSISGVFATKVKPVFNGGGTVLLCILDSEYEKASNVLIETVQEMIDPTNDGSGLGYAPIGHIVTVRSVDESVIDISAKITLKEGYSLQIIEEEIIEIVEEYFLELRKTWADNENIMVRLSQIETRMLGVTGVIDIENTKINGKNINEELLEFDIPVLGVIDYE